MADKLHVEVPVPRGRPRMHNPTDRARTIRIHNDLWNALDAVAALKYISTQQLIHVILADWIRNKENRK